MLCNPRPPVRRAAINASTVFAVTLAIVAGLIFAWVFKVVVLDRKPRPPAEETKYKLTVAAVNLLPKMEVLPSHVKTVNVSKEDYDRAEKRARELGSALLRGNQPVRRTTVLPVTAEDPMYENQFEPIEYPKPISSLLRDGKRSVILEVPAKNTMVQVGDKVDVLCSLANEGNVFGPSGASATAVLAKGLKVIARFNTTRTAAQPPKGPNRSYTLEAEPWQASILELARTIGGSFALSVVSGTGQSGDDNPILNTAGNVSRPGEDEAYRIVEARYARDNRVTVADLALLFGVTDPPPEILHRIERLYGLQHAPDANFPGFSNELLEPRPASGPPAPKAPPVQPTPGVKPAGMGMSRPYYGPTAPTAVASADKGFRPVGYSAPTAGCPGCGKKQ